MNKTSEELLKEKQKLEHEKEQLEHRMTRMENRKNYFESTARKKRNHRLITRGAALESIIPEIKEMSEHSFYMGLEKFFENENNRISFCEEMEKQKRIEATVNMKITRKADGGSVDSEERQGDS